MPLPVPGSSRGRETIDFIVVEELATLVWLANLAALELHTPQWRVAADGDRSTPTCSSSTSTRARRPGSPSATRSRCWSGTGSPTTGWSAYPKTSGRKGMQLAADCPARRPPTRSART